MLGSIFPIRLKQVMDEKGMKPAELHRRTGVSKGTISKYLKSPNKKKHDALIVLKFAKALDVNSEWLYGFTDIRKPFHEPSIVDIYGQLSEGGKKELQSYAAYLLDKEAAKAGGNGHENGAL
ncbi:MAG TPA: helix-turn-helix transcriptional regulator [Bacillota bacterium]|nr:helix-turn-helix transcriptional regulator [Bacillota bacterium]